MHTRREQVYEMRTAAGRRHKSRRHYSCFALFGSNLIVRRSMSCSGQRRCGDGEHPRRFKGHKVRHTTHIMTLSAHIQLEQFMR
jgi:hypothetical protein